MSRNRILHLADLHLGDSQAWLGPQAAARRAEADALLSRIVESVLDGASAVGGVLIAGDLFDSHDPPPDLVRRTLADLRRLDEAGIRLLTVPGNHDEYSYPACVYRREGAQWPGTLVTQPEPGLAASWNLGGTEIEIYAMAFVAGRSKPPFDRFAVGPGPARKVAVFHGSLDVPWSDRSIPLSSTRLAALELDYLALGHLHPPLEKKVGRFWAAYPGRIEGGGFDDPGGADLLTVDLTGPEAALQRIPWPSRPHREIECNLSGLAGPEELLERVAAQADPAAILRLNLCGLAAFPVDPEELRRKLASRFFHLEVAAEAEGHELPSLEALRTERTIRGLFARIAEKQIAAAGGEDERALRSAALRHGLSAFGPPEEA